MKEKEKVGRESRSRVAGPVGASLSGCAGTLSPEEKGRARIDRLTNWLEEGGQLANLFLNHEYDLPRNVGKVIATVVAIFAPSFIKRHRDMTPCPTDIETAEFYCSVYRFFKKVKVSTPAVDIPFIKKNLALLKMMGMSAHEVSDSMKEVK